ncbi:unnamed protein product [Cylindrotheca closterium]|uniref:Uncharacterized protein n=1 Tax=Cylindrotheca closterium TaxID=2856 RepID=A0AAD2FVM3_9STRA|nr:unnamed protein product [Cylindrotheca closterium]
MSHESTVGKEDLVVGQEYFGSIVVQVSQDVQDSKDTYKIKRTVTLKSGVVLIEDYHRSKSLGEVESYESSLPASEIDEPKKDDSDLRAKARALLAAKKKKAEPEPEPSESSESEAPPSILDDNWETLPAVVIAEDDVPDLEAVAMKSEEPTQIGVWRTDENTKDFEPMDVVIHKEEPTDLEPDEPHGQVVIANDAKPNKVGKIAPGKLIFLAPDATPDPVDCKPVGHWRPGRLGQGWPPTGDGGEPRKVGKLPKWQAGGGWKTGNAIVYPKKSVPNVNFGGTSRGVWKSKNSVDDKWKAQPVTLYKGDPDIDDDRPQGVWGTDPGAKPDVLGQWKPKDLHFYPPGESPENDKECVVQGKWSFAEKSSWPPSTESKTGRSVGKLNMSKLMSHQKATVFPIKKAPKRSNSGGATNGVWKFKDKDAERKASKWIPANVEVVKNGEEAHDWNDDGRPNGVWGVSAKTDPDDKDLKPTDVHFYPPDEKPEEDFKPVGKWRVTPRSSFPPTSVSRSLSPMPDSKEEAAAKEARKVGKLQLPGAFSGK